MATKDLGEKIYECTYDSIITHKNDGNGHLPYEKYPDYTRPIRDSFLRSFGWSDESFGLMGLSFVVKNHGTDNKVEMHEGDRFKMKLEVFASARVKLFMVYTYLDYQGENALAVGTSKCCFTRRGSRNPILTPKFFLDTIKTSSASSSQTS